MFLILNTRQYLPKPRKTCILRNPKPKALHPEPSNAVHGSGVCTSCWHSTRLSRLQGATELCVRSPDNTELYLPILQSRMSPKGPKNSFSIVTVTQSLTEYVTEYVTEEYVPESRKAVVKDAGEYMQHGTCPRSLSPTLIQLPSPNCNTNTLECKRLWDTSPRITLRGSGVA